MPIAASKHLQASDSSIVITLCQDFVVFEHLTNEPDMANWTLQHHDGPPRAPQQLCAGITIAMRAAGFRRPGCVKNCCKQKLRKPIELCDEKSFRVLVREWSLYIQIIARNRSRFLYWLQLI
jgi:hypothetical protein